MKELMKEKTLWASFLLVLLSMLAGIPFHRIEIPLASGSFVQFCQHSLKSQMILFFIPIAAVLPMGASYVREYSQGFLKLYLVRISRISYIRRKTLQIYAGGFLPFFFAGAVLLAFSFLFIYPLELTGENSWEEIVAVWKLLMRISFTAGIVAELSGIFAAVFQNYYMAYGLPFVSFYMMIILKERYFTEMYVMYPAEWVRCQEDWGIDNLGIWLFLALFTIGAMLLHGLALYWRLEEI